MTSVKVIPRLVQVKIGESNHEDRQYALVLWGIDEPVPAVEYAEVVDVLDVAFLEAETERVLLRDEVHRVERLGLRLCDGRDVCRAGEAKESREKAARVLDNDVVIFPEQQWALSVRRVTTESTELNA